MGYTLIYRHGFNRTSDQWHGSLDGAQAEALSCIRSGAADYIDIYDARGQLVDSYPARDSSRACAQSPRRIRKSAPAKMKQPLPVRQITAGAEHPGTPDQ